MAVNHALLSSQLIDKLNNENEDLQERFNIAEIVFTSSTIPSIRKEEIIIEWLSKQIKDRGCSGSPIPYDVLDKCVSGPRLSSLTLEIRRNIIVFLVEALSTPLNIENYAVEEKRKSCIISILSSAYFLKLFCRDVDSFAKLISEYCSCSELTSSNACELNRVSRIISEYSKQCLLHEDLQLSFIHQMMVPLCLTLSKLTDEGCDECEQEIYNCVEQIVFREANLTEQCITLFRQKKNPEDVSFAAKLVHILKKLPCTRNADVVRVAYTLFLRGVLNNNKDDHSQVFKVFTLLCYCLGVKVKGVVSIEMKPVKNWDREDTFIVITSMVLLMDKMKLSIDCSIDNDITLQNWFTSMIIGLSNIQSGDMSPEFYRMITAILRFNALLIESAHKLICTHIMLCKKSDESIKAEYNSLLKAIFDGSLLLGRLQKFLAKFLSCVEEHLQYTSDVTCSVEDIFPKSITEHFCTAVSKMPGSQVLMTTKTLQYHFQLISTNKLESSGPKFDSTFLLWTEMVVHLLNLFLSGVKIADFNTPTIVKDKFSSILEEIGESLEKFAQGILDCDHNDRLLSCFLNLCHFVGTSILLMWEYDRDGRRPLEEMDNNPVNLSYVHSYIDAVTWDRISLRVHSSSSDEVKNYFNMLIIQKMVAVSQIEEGTNGPGTHSARYLLANASPMWHWDNVTVLAPLLLDNELLGLIEGLIKSAGLDHSRWIPFVSSECFTRNRRLVVAASTGFLSAMSKHIHKNRKNGAVSHRVMSKVAVVPLLEYELSRLFEENEELECDLRCFFEEMIAELETYLLEDPPPAFSNEDFAIGGFIEIITKISYEDCSYAMEVCMLIAVIALLCDIPVGTNNDILLLEKLNAFLKEPIMRSPAFLLNLHSGALLRFLVKRTEHYSDQRLLIQRFCNFSATSSYTNHILIKYVKAPTAATLWQTSAVIKALAMYSKESNFEVSKSKSMIKLLHATVPILEKEEPTADLLPDFFVSFKRAWKLNEPSLIKKLQKKYQPYLKLAISNLDKGKPLIKMSLKLNHSLTNEFPESFLMDLWEKVFKVQDIKESDIFHNFCSCLSWEEIKIVLSQMHTMFEEGMAETPVSNEKIERCLFLWKGIIWVNLGLDQRKEVGEALNNLMTPLMELVSKWPQQSNPLVVPVLDFLAEIGHCLALHSFGSHFLDMYLVILSSIPLEGPNTVDNLNAGLDALIALFMFRRSLIVDRLPPVLQIFRLFAHALGKISAPDLEEPYLFRTEACADKLTRGSEIMIKQKKDLRRVVPYIISDLLSVFENNTIHPDIKAHFVNTLSTFFSELDDHGQAYLSTSLNPASQELYKTYFDQYNRYYKYQGKI